MYRNVLLWTYIEISITARFFNFDFQTQMWATENLPDMHPHSSQKRFSVKVWMGVVNDFLVGSYLLQTKLNDTHCAKFFLPGLLQIVAKVAWYQI